MNDLIRRELRATAKTLVWCSVAVLLAYAAKEAALLWAA